MAFVCAVEPAPFSEPLEQVGLAPAAPELLDVADVELEPADEPEAAPPVALLPLEEQAASATALARRPATAPAR
jgi:hypothetical protein